MPANIACTGRLGSARFQAPCVAWSWPRQNGVISSRPADGNARRWAAVRESLTKHYIKDENHVQATSST